MSSRILSVARHEIRDAPFKYVLIGGSGVAAVLAIVMLAALWLYPDTLTDQYVTRPIPPFSEPMLQSSPRRDMDVFRAQQLQELNGTYWLDRDHGVVHLPIEDAMRKVAAEGIADWPAGK